MPDTAEYLSRIRECAEGKDPMAAQAQSPEHIAELIANIPTEKLRARPAPDKWSVAEILAHLAEDEMATAWRYRQIVEHSGCELQGFDQDLWADRFDYAGASMELAMPQLRALRASNLALWRRLGLADLAREGMHSERGPESLGHLLKLMAAHDLVHRRQIDRVLGAA